MFASKLSRLAAAAVLAFGASSAANATVSISFLDGANQVICSTDTGTCVGSNAAAFTVVTSFDDNTTPGNAKIEVTATNWFGWSFGGSLGGSFTAAQYGLTEAVLNLDNFSITRLAGGGTGTLGLNSIGLDYVAPVGVAKSSFGSSSMIRQSGPNLTAASSQFTSFYGDDAGGFPGPLDLLDSCLSTGVANSRSCSISEAWDDLGGGDFSMRIAQEITLEAGRTVKTQASLTTTAGVPEPMTLSLVGVALLGVAAAARRRSTKA
jgi:hypothetical protein